MSWVERWALRSRSATTMPRAKVRPPVMRRRKAHRGEKRACSTRGTSVGSHELSPRPHLNNIIKAHKLYMNCIYGTRSLFWKSYVKIFRLLQHRHSASTIHQTKVLRNTLCGTHEYAICLFGATASTGLRGGSPRTVAGITGTVTYTSDEASVRACSCREIDYKH